MKTLKRRAGPVFFALAFCALLAGASRGAWAATPGELIVEPPTLRCAGFHWEITGDPNENATARIEFREVGGTEWRRGLEFMRAGTDGYEFVAGSLFNLAPGTAYEAKVTLVDPDGVEGETTQIVEFNTRTEPELPDGGTTYHVYAEDHAGAKAHPVLKDWRAALADAEDSPLKPGDTVAMHSGEYHLAPNVEVVKTRTVAEVSTAPKPQMPEGGTTWHVYPVRYRGEKEEPVVRLNHYETPILNTNRDGEQVVKPGDTVLFHAGTYKVDKYNYRDRLFQGPKWGVWWFRRGGEPGRPVLFKAAGDGEVIFDGDGNYAIFELAATRHLWIDGLTFRNALSGFVAGHDGWDTAENLTVTNCTFEDIRMPVYADTAPEDWHFSGNEGLDVIHSGPWHEAFGSIDVNVDGEPSRPIVIRGEGDAMIEGGDNYAVFDVTHSDHVWIRDLKARNTECVVMTGLYPFGQAPDGLIVTGLDAENVRMGVYGDESTGEGWYIADNRFIGRAVGNMSMNQHVSPFGINVCGHGHVVEHNHLEWFQDGIDLGWWDRDTSYDRSDFTSSVDVYRNYVFGSGDNSLEADGSYFNGRFIENAFLTNNSPSTQSTPGAPYYFIRNIFYNDTRSDSTFKLPSSIIAVHNVFGTARGLRWRDNNLRFWNNLFVFTPSRKRGDEKSRIITYKPARPGAASDYNGLRVVPEVMKDKPFAMRHRRDIKEYATLEAYSQATGFEEHSILIPGWEELFVGVPEPDGETRYRLEGLDFRLTDGAPAIDAGKVLANINEDYRGEAPDLGPIEHGDPMPHYGPRESEE